MHTDDAENTLTGVHEAMPSVRWHHHNVTCRGVKRLVTDREAAFALGDHDRGYVRVPMRLGASWIRRVLTDDDLDIAEAVIGSIQQAQTSATLELVRLYLRGANHLPVCSHQDYLSARRAEPSGSRHRA
jgi:hypothetical protein